MACPAVQPCRTHHQQHCNATNCAMLGPPMHFLLALALPSALTPKQRTYTTPIHPSPTTLCCCSARLDCSWRARGTNILNSATGCRTVVQRPQSICPVGCNLIEQLRFNTTVNRTQLVTRCSCKAGNQPCPGTWTACTCYEALLPRNVTGGFTVCSETQGECERKCNLAVSGTPRLAPLCPVALDPFLSTNATSAPVYPMFGWNIASQGSDVAPLTVAAGRRLMQLLGIRRGRAVLVAASDEQLAGKMQSRVVWNKGPGQTSCASHLQYRAWSQWVVCGVQKATQRLMGLMGRMTVTHSR